MKYGCQAASQCHSITDEPLWDVEASITREQRVRDVPPIGVDDSEAASLQARSDELGVAMRKGYSS